MGSGTFRLADVLPAEFVRETGPRLVRKLSRSTGLSALTAWRIHEDTTVDPEVEQPAESEPALTATGAPVPYTAHLMTIGRDPVERCDISDAEDRLTALRAEPVANRWTVDLRFRAFDADPRGLWDIPAVQRYLRSLRLACPFWPWYLRPTEDEPGIGVGFLLCVLAGCDDPRRLTLTDVDAALTHIFMGVNGEARHAGLSEEELRAMTPVIKEAMMSVLKARLE